MKNLTELKGGWKEAKDSMKQTFAMIKDGNLFLKESKLQKQFFLGQITPEEYYERKKILEEDLRKLHSKVKENSGNESIPAKKYKPSGVSGRI